MLAFGLGSPRYLFILVISVYKIRCVATLGETCDIIFIKICKHNFINRAGSQFATAELFIIRKSEI